MLLHVGERLLTQSLSTLQECGDGRGECVVLWLAGRREPNVVSAVEHPLHRATDRWYGIDQTWLMHLWQRLQKDNATLVAQVHSHSHRAFHSSADDQFPVLSTPGFVSVVVPNFGAGDVDLFSWFVAELQPDGTWREHNATEALR